MLSGTPPFCICRLPASISAITVTAAWELFVYTELLPGSCLYILEASRAGNMPHFWLEGFTLRLILTKPKTGNMILKKTPNPLVKVFVSDVDCQRFGLNYEGFLEVKIYG